MIEILNESFPELENCSVKIETGTSYSSLEIALANIPTVGEVQKVVHYRKRKIGEYLTIVSGQKHTIAILGGLTSGYKGTGSNASIELLKQIGFKENLIESLYYDATYDNAKITLEK